MCTVFFSYNTKQQQNHLNLKTTLTQIIDLILSASVFIQFQVTTITMSYSCRLKNLFETALLLVETRLHLLRGYCLNFVFLFVCVIAELCDSCSLRASQTNRFHFFCNLLFQFIPYSVNHQSTVFLNSEPQSQNSTLTLQSLHSFQEQNLAFFYYSSFTCFCNISKLGRWRH